MSLRRVVLLAGVSLVLAYSLWSLSGRDISPAPSPRLGIGALIEYGRNTGNGNLVGIQPYMTPQDYATEAAFATKLDGYFQAAGKRGWLSPSTIVVLPEYLGTWLVVVGEKAGVYRAPTVQAAVQLMVLSNLPAFLRQVPFAKAEDPVTYSVFAMKARKMAAIYHRVCSGLADKYHATIVAGSILLPSPTVAGGRLVASPGPLYNVSVVYQPGGNPYQLLVKKIFPTAVEKPFVTRGLLADLPVFSTPAGRLGVLICADSWFPESYGPLRAQGAEIIVTPSHISPDGSLKQTWPGCSGWPTPKDVDPGDPGRITEREAWLRYALMGRVDTTAARQAMVVTLRGRLWDVGSDGAIDLYREGRVWQHPDRAQALIVNSWL